MRTTKLLVTAGAVALCASSAFVLADDPDNYGTDNPAQAAARAALLQALQQPVVTNAAPPRAPAPAEPVFVKPVVAMPEQTASPDATGIAPDNAAQAAARAAVLKELQQPFQPTPASPANPSVSIPKTVGPAMPVVETPAQPSEPMVTGITPDNAAQAAARAAVLKELQSSAQSTSGATNQSASVPSTLTTLPQTITIVSSDNAAQAAARKEVLEKLGPTYAAPPTTTFDVIKKGPDSTTVESAPTAQKPAVAQINQPAVKFAKPAGKPTSGANGYLPIVAPPLPISAEQQAQLDALTAKYRADQITPQDYFKQREAILGNH